MIQSAASKPVPEAQRVFKTKVALALEMVAHQRRIGVRFSWVGADGFYGNDPAFLRGLAATGEVFVADVHCNQLIFLDDPKPMRRSSRRKASVAASQPSLRRTPRRSGLISGKRSSPLRLGNGSRSVRARAESCKWRCCIAGFSCGMARRPRRLVGI
jgi:SRSO17 transposase